MKDQVHKSLSILNEMLLLAIGIAMVVISAIAFNNMKFDTTIKNQIVIDWTRQPFVEVKVVFGYKSACPNGFENIYARKWPGTKYGCDCINVFSQNISISHRDKVFDEFCTSTERYFGCIDVYGLQADTLISLGGFTICGRRSGQSFVDA